MATAKAKSTKKSSAKKKKSSGGGGRTTLLAFCRSLPLATEDVKWGNDLMFSVGAKMFAGFSASGKDAGFGCKVSEDDFGVLTTMDGIKPAAYAARFHWIDIEDGAVPIDEATKLIRGSYDLVKAGLSQKLQRSIDEAMSSSSSSSASSPPKKKTSSKKKKASK